MYSEIELTKKLVLIFTSRKWIMQDKFHYARHPLIYSEEENHVMTSESMNHVLCFSYQQKIGGHGIGSELYNSDDTERRRK